MAKWSLLPWRQSSASKYRPDTLNYGCISTSKSGEFSVGDANNKAVPVMPVGCVIPFAGAAAPTGWLLCQGQAVSRTTYAQLFSVIGTTYGSGDGSTTFNLPDMRGRVAVGSDANLGAHAGSNVHTNTMQEMYAHRHGFEGMTDAVDRAFILTDSGADYVGSGSSSSGYKATFAWGTRNTGDGVAYNFMQASLYLNHIVKV